MHPRFSRNLLALAVFAAATPVAAQQALKELVIIGDETSASALPGSARHMWSRMQTWPP